MKKYLFFLAFILPFIAIGQVIMHPTNITFDSKGRVDSVYYEKDSTIRGTITGTPTKMVAMPTKDSVVKGWIVYYNKGFVTKQWTTMCYSTLNGHYPIKVSSTKQGVQQLIKEATAHYRVIRIFDDMPYRPKYWEIYKIEVDGKPFDLNKYYQFIHENQVVE